MTLTPFNRIPPLLVLAAALALLIYRPVCAAELNGVTLPERVQADGDTPELVLNGAGVRVIVLFNMYVAALYLPAPGNDGEAILRAHQPSRLHIQLLHNITVGEFKSAITGVLRETLTPEQELPLESRLQELDAIFATLPTMKKGTIFFMDYKPGTGTIVRVNGQEKGRISGADFNEALLRIWIGERPRDPDLRKALLGIRKSE
jgi:hypothetical protein